MAVLVIGDRRTVIGLRMVGVEGRPVENLAEARAELEAGLRREDVLLLLVTYEWAAGLHAEVNRLKTERLLPVILEIPGGDLRPPEQPVGDVVEQALGIRLRS